MRRLGIAVAALSVVLAGALAGCGFGSDRFVAIRNACAEDADCDTGFCNAARRCEAREIAPIEIAFEVAYRSSPEADPTTWQVAPQTLTQSGAVEIDVPALTSISGTVRYRSAYVPARITLRGPVVAPGLTPALAQTQSVTSLPEDPSGAQNDFRVVYPRGRTVRMRVEPLGNPSTTPVELRGFDASAVMPPYERDIVLDGDTVRADITYGSGLFDTRCTQGYPWDCSVTLSFAPTVDSPDGPERNLNGLSVLLVLADDTVISSYGRIVDGSVTLRVGKPAIADGAANPPVYVLVGPSGERADFNGIANARPDFPTFHVGPLALPTSANTPIPPIELPVFPPIAFVGSVEDEDLAPLEGATVRFSARELDDGYLGDVVYQPTTTTTTTEAHAVAGRFQVALFPGAYDVLITPTRVDDGAVLQTTVTVYPPLNGGDTITGQIFRVPPPTVVYGVVRGIDGADGAGVDVSAVPYPRSTARAASMRTDDLGMFHLPIDRGDYDVVAVPSVGSFFATQVATFPEEAPTTSDRSGEFVIRLSPPIFVSGSVTMAGSPAATARINAYRVLRGIVDRSVLVGTADADGTSFEMLFAP